MPDNHPNQSILLDVYQRLGGIEAKIDDVREVRLTANEAKTTADTALLISEQNTQAISQMQSDAVTQKRWLIGTAFSTLSVIIAVVALFIN